MAKRNIISGDIPSIHTPWDNGTDAYPGTAVEKFLKSQLSSKVGWLDIPPEKDSDGFYHVWGFADRDSYLDYLADPEANAHLKISDVPVPIMEQEEGVRNIVTLTRISSGEIVTNKAQASVTVSYLWQQYNPVTKDTTDQDEDATLTVSCRTQSTDGAWGAWDPAKEFSVIIRSGQTRTIDLSRFLTSDATYQVRLVATGETSGVTSTPVTVNIIYSNVGLVYEGSVATVYKGDSFQLPFRISGGVRKQLRVRIGDYTKNFSLGTTSYIDSTYGATVLQSEFNLPRGAIKAEAWVAFGEELASETDHVSFQFIYIPEGDTGTTPILAVTDIMEEFPNWTRATIFRFAVYNPSAQSTPLTIILQDRSSGQVYISKSIVCINGEDYAFDENFALEPDSDEQPASISAQVSFANVAGITFGNNLYFTIDNSENFAPTRGANLVLSPEKQSLTIDGCTLLVSSLLSNPEDSNSGWKVNTEYDSTDTAVSVPVLSVGAGNRLTIPFELFTVDTGHNNDGVEGSMTAEFDIKVRDIVGDAPVIDASAPFNGGYTGLRVYPTRAVCLSRDNFSEDICDVHFQEEVREHIAVNIIRNLRGEGMNLVRIYVNGKANREFIYSDDDAFVPIGAKGAQSLTIGSDEADTDIYGLRIYKGQQLGSAQIQNDYMAGMPTIEDKKLFKRYNSIFNGSEIGYDLCNAMGLNTILRRIPEGGHYPSRENQSKQTDVSVDVRIYTERGNAASLDLRHSGTFTGMTDKGQGTSAKGYYWWNITDGFEDDKEISSEEYDVANPAHYTADGKYFRKVSYFNSLDGVSQVYAGEYELEDGRGGITKLVGKCNYASPMQSHKLGAVWAYDELWQAIVNNGGANRERPVLDGHAACYEKPFLAFYQIGDGNPVFCGFQTWGSGKGDKHTFGYDNKNHPEYMCVSGADNGSTAALFQMPWVVSKNARGAWEGNIYPKSVIINTGDTKNGYCYKAGASDTLSFEVEIGNKYDGGENDKGTVRIEDEAKDGTENTLFTLFADFANFVFASSPLLKPYAGTEAQLMADSANLARDHQYWLFNTGADRFNVYYYNPASSRFEKILKVPTAWGDDNRPTAYGSPKITGQLAGVTISVTTIEGKRSMTLEQAMEALGTSDPDVLNECFSKARVAWFKDHADAFIDITDIIFHQAFCKLEAATDNRTKNTYYWINPAVDKLVRLKQDDLDTIKATDNQGRQTKPYHTLEHTKSPDGSNYWNGENNVFFTLVERAYPDRLRNMMRDIFDRMALICGSVGQYYQQRFYWVQEYFPAVAYNETSRLLYEVAQVKMMKGLLDVSQDPITQAIGDQLECEKQFMNRRLPMLMSWCEYETEGSDGALSFRSVNNNAGLSPVYDIEFTAYQYIYPKMAIGGKMATVYARSGDSWIAHDGSEPYLCAPGETVRLVCDTDSNTQFSLRWMHYAMRLGNLGSLPCADEGSITIIGKRLRSLECSAPDGIPIEFHPRGLTISNCRNLEKIDLTNASAFAGSFSGDFPRLRTLSLGGSGYTSVSLPRTSTITTVILPASVNAIVVNGQPNLSTLDVASLYNLRTLSILGSHKLGRQTQTLVQLAFSQASDVASVEVENVEWSAVSAALIMWLQGLRAHLTGSISVSDAITFDNKLALAATYGNIDSRDNPLYISYPHRSITSVSIQGPSQTPLPADYRYTLVCSPAAGNNFTILPDGTPAIRWQLDEGAESFASFEHPSDGLLSVMRLDVSGSGIRYPLKCTVSLSDGTSLHADLLVAFYRRIPKIGDFAYADGTFDDFFIKGKTLAGIVYKIDEMWQGADDDEPIVFTGYDKPTGEFKTSRKLVGYRILVDAKDYIRIRNVSGGINTTAIWGLCYNNDDHIFESDIKAATGLSSVSNVPTLTDITVRDIPGGGTSPTTSNYLDVDSDDGFKDFSGVSAAVNDWAGYDNTQKIIRHADRIMKSYLLSDLNSRVALSYTDDAGDTREISAPPRSINELADCLLIITNANNKQERYQRFLYPAAYCCHLYEPEVNEVETLDPQYSSGCWYLPAIGEIMRLFSFFAKSRTGGMGATAAEGANTLPSESVIEKMIREAMDSSVPNDIKNNVSKAHLESGEYTMQEISAINRYFHSMVEAEKPVFSMAIWRTLVVSSPISFIQHDTEYHWSSSELDASLAAHLYFSNGDIAPSYVWTGTSSRKSYSHRVRPAVAYRFFL